MKTQTMTRNLSLLAVLAVAPAAFATNHTPARLEMEREGVELIREVEEVARDVRFHAGRLNSFNLSSKITRWTHIHHLDLIKDEINGRLAPSLKRLNEIEPQLPEWKQSSIRAMLDAAKALAGDVNEAILMKNEAISTPPFMNEPYKSLVTRIYGHAETLVKTSDAAGDYASARLKANEAGLKVPHK